MRTKFEIRKFKKLVNFEDFNICVKRTILATENKIIIRVKLNLSDLKIQLARKIRTDVLSIYRKVSSLGAPELSTRKRMIPTPASQRTVSKFVRRDEQIETKNEVENGLGKIAMDLSLERKKAVSNPNSIAIEVMSIFQMMLPMIVGCIMPQVRETDYRTI